MQLQALAEILADANMFGGIESTRFKIKFKRVERREKMYCDCVQHLQFIKDKFNDEHEAE